MVAGGKGLWDAVFILYVVVPALLLYQVSKEAGTFDVLRCALADSTPNDLFHVLPYVFGSLILIGAAALMGLMIIGGA